MRETRNLASRQQKLRTASGHEPEAASRTMMEPEARLDEVRLRHLSIGYGLKDVLKMLQGKPAPLLPGILRRSHSGAP